jgi:hypothetical protein
VERISIKEPLLKYKVTYSTLAVGRVVILYIVNQNTMTNFNMLSNL